MTKICLYYNQRCSKSRQALKLLQQQNINPELIYYLKTPPKVQQIVDLLKKLNMQPKELIRTKESLFTDLGLETATDQQLIKAMSQHPQLIQRPIAINGASAIIARPAELIQEILP